MATCGNWFLRSRSDGSFIVRELFHSRVFCPRVSAFTLPKWPEWPFECPAIGKPFYSFVRYKTVHFSIANISSFFHSDVEIDVSWKCYTLVDSSGVNIFPRRFLRTRGKSLSSTLTLKLTSRGNFILSSIVLALIFSFADSYALVENLNFDLQFCRWCS